MIARLDSNSTDSGIGMPTVASAVGAPFMVQGGALARGRIRRIRGRRRNFTFAISRLLRACACAKLGSWTTSR
ncbi:MAG TPA: hypothetical protein VGB91_01755 [Rhizomicrobium sp.]